MAIIAETPYYPTPQASLLSSRNVFVPTYSDTDELPFVTKSIVLSADATLKLTIDGQADPITFAFPKGTYMLSVRKIWATGTTAAAGSILCLA